MQKDQKLKQILTNYELNSKCNTTYIILTYFMSHQVNFRAKIRKVFIEFNILQEIFIFENVRTHHWKRNIVYIKTNYNIHLCIDFCIASPNKDLYFKSSLSSFTLKRVKSKSNVKISNRRENFTTSLLGPKKSIFRGNLINGYDKVPCLAITSDIYCSFLYKVVEKNLHVKIVMQSMKIKCHVIII